MRQLGVETEAELRAQIESRNISAEKLDLLYKQAEQNRENERIIARTDRSVRSSRSQVAELGRAYASIEQAVANLPNDARGALKDLVGNIRTQVNEIIARRITDNLFGNLFARVEDQLRGRKPIDTATADYVNSTLKANAALINFASTLTSATPAVKTSAVNDNIAGSIGKGFGASKAGFDDAASTIFTESRDIVVTASKSGRLNQAVDGGSDLEKRGVVRQSGVGFSASGWVHVRSQSERTLGAIEAYTAGAEIRPRRGRWLWLPTDDIPSRAGRQRMTPELWNRLGFESKVGKLVMIRSVNGWPLLVVYGAGVSASGKARSARSLRKDGGLRKGQVAREMIVAFIGIPRTSRRARVDVPAIMKEVQAMLPGLVEQQLRRK